MQTALAAPSINLAHLSREELTQHWRHEYVKMHPHLAKDEHRNTLDATVKLAVDQMLNAPNLGMDITATAAAKKKTPKEETAHLSREELTQHWRQEYIKMHPHLAKDEHRNTLDATVKLIVDEMRDVPMMGMDSIPNQAAVDELAEAAKRKAASASGKREGEFNSIDTDANGWVNQDELFRHWVEQYRAMHPHLAAQEHEITLNTTVKMAVKQMTKRGDLDKDGKISLSEYMRAEL
jgi:hypothetical protein